MATGDPLDWIALDLLVGPSLAAKRLAVQKLGSPGDVAHRLPPEAFAEFGRLTDKDAASIRSSRRGLERRARAERRRARKLGLALVSPGDPTYPAEFETLAEPPILLYSKGLLRTPSVRVAVVGSRHPTAYGRRVASGLGSTLAARGITVVSGGARGIDTAAHTGALEAGGATVAVLGSGFARLYPAENVALFDRIAAEGGAVLSEFRLDAPPEGHHFLRRNRLISGLSAAVVVVEAARRSGSLNTASWALEQGREVMAVPGPVSSLRSEGCHRLIQQGAKLVHHSDDILEELSPMYRSALPGNKEATGEVPAGDAVEPAPDEAAVLALLDEVEPMHIDALAERAPFGVARLQAALFTLVLRGSVEETTGRYYVSRPVGT